MFNQFSRNCYYVMRETYERPKGFEAKFFYYLHWSIAIYGIRYYYIALIGYSNFPTIPYLDWKLDPICNFLYRNKEIYDAFIPVMMFLLEVFHITVKYRLFNLQDIDCIVWRWWYEMIVVNQDAYHKNLLSKQELQAIYVQKELALLNRWNAEDSLLVKLSVPEFALQTIGKIFVRWDTFKNLDYVDKKRLFAQKLDILPNISDHLRVKMLFISLFADSIIGFVQFFQFFNTIFLLLVFLPPMVSPYSDGYKIFAICWFLFDAVVVTYEILGLFRSALFFAYCTVLAYTVYSGHVVDLTKKVSRVLFKNIKETGEIVLKVKDYLLFQEFMVGHTKASYLFSTGGVKLFSFIMWAFLITNTPINIYCIRRLVFIEQPLLVDVIVWFIFSLQFCACLVVMGPLARGCQILHQPSAWIPRLQLMITHADKGQQLNWMLLKFKYNDLFFRLLFGPKYAICFGPTNPITYMTALEYVMMYGGYLLMVFSQMIESQSKGSTSE